MMDAHQVGWVMLSGLTLGVWMWGTLGWPWVMKTHHNPERYKGTHRR
jgi:hypothetical protein